MARATEYIVIRRVATDSLRVAPIAVGYVPPPDPECTWGGPFKSKIAAMRAVEAKDETLRRQLYPVGVEAPVAKAEADPVTPVTPIVHLNGTGAAELLLLREEAHEAVSNALDALKRMAPNGRDYYPEPGRMERAVEQHTRRMRALTDLMDEIEAECMDIHAAAKH